MRVGMNSRGRMYVSGGPIIGLFVGLFYFMYLFLKFGLLLIWVLLVALYKLTSALCVATARWVRGFRQRHDEQPEGTRARDELARELRVIWELISQRVRHDWTMRLSRVAPGGRPSSHSTGGSRRNRAA